jgi:hypothetical protein
MRAHFCALEIADVNKNKLKHHDFNLNDNAWQMMRLHWTMSTLTNKFAP